ncbi:MAG: NAD(P)/FAD-dependent oxidoreductase [Pseudonocardia sediminis]
MTERVDAVIVGAGFAGMYQLLRLREAGLSTRVFDAAGDVGGTWYWNRYPGARCDVESMAYSYSFSPELEQEWTWTSRYADQPEILSYLNHVADRFDLRRDITFSTSVLSARYDEAAARWTVVTDGGETVSAQFLIMATGCLSMSKAPEVPGEERFGGVVAHTGHWPHDGVDVAGKRVAVIGTGSSGIQAIPILAASAAEVTVFQRTPNFSMPAYNRPLDDGEISERKATYPEYRAAARASGFGLPTVPATQSAFDVDDAERTARYQAAWEKGVLVAVAGSFTDVRTDLAANDTAAEFVRSKIRETVTDPATAETLSPRSYPFGTKRPCLDTGYYETYNRENVHLVDLRATPLQEITEDGVRTSEAEYGCDVIVFATGFDAMTGALNAIDIRGRDGLPLTNKWSEGPRTYLGLAVAGFPNLFVITGPGSPSVLSNMVVSIEQHVDWVTDAVLSVRGRGLSTIEADARAEDEWVAHVEAVGNMTLFPQADSWYMGANVPGKPRVFMAYVGGVGPYRQRCDDVAAKDYEGFALA